METTPAEYIIYEISGPRGLFYIGATKAKLHVRWGQHCRRAKENPQHPFYKDILEFGKGAFELRVIDTCKTKEEANAMEVAYISKYGSAVLYNLSPGGDYDILVAPKIFWQRMKEDPIARENYIAKLCQAQRNRPEGAHDHLSNDGAKWRSENARKAYYISRRNIRLAIKANTTKGVRQALRDKKASKSLKEKLLWKHKRKSEQRQKIVASIWAARSEDEKKIIGANIAEALKNKHSTDEFFRKANAMQLCAARGNIDRSIQGPAASRGLRRYWSELKADPERYAAVMASRRKSRGL